MLEWNVYIADFNRKRIEQYNIFNHSGFSKDVKQAYNSFKDDFEAFCKQLDNALMYYFWCKCEWEIVLSDFPPSDSFKAQKIDVYSQVKLNWNIFAKQVWDYFSENSAS